MKTRERVAGVLLIVLLLLAAELLPLYSTIKAVVLTSWESTHLAKRSTEEKEKNVKESKLILAYTKFYGEDLLTYGKTHREIEQTPSPLANCTYTCEWSTNISDIGRSDAVVFHLYNNKGNKDLVVGQLPVRSNINQKWVLMAREPPAFFYPGQLKLLNGLYNLTISYQDDSDIRIPYGGYWPRKEQTLGLKQSLKDYLSGRDKMVVWLASNCVTSSRREEYVNELKRHIDVDVFGECGEKSKQDKGTQNRFRKTLADQYRFYLAFENSDCDDYITEKFWRNLNLGMIPIVRGQRANYLRHAPPNSYIHADTFISAEKLAHYLIEVSQNSTLFHRHHQWRLSYTADYKPFTINKNWLCNLCERVHTSRRKTIDVLSYFSERERCFTYLDHYGRDRTGEHMEDLTRW